MLVDFWFYLLLAFATPLVPLVAQATPSIGRESETTRRDVVSLREYIDIRLTGLEQKIDALNAQRQLAIDKAEGTINLRLEGMNEFRNQLKDQAAQFATKDEFAQRAKEVDGRLIGVENRLSSIDGSLKILMGLFAVIQIAVGAWLKKWSGPREEKPTVKEGVS